MKKILLDARHEDYEKIKPILKDLSHTSAAIDRDGNVQIRVYVPDSEIDTVIEKLREPLDLRYKQNVIEVSTPDFVISPILARAEERNKKEKKPEITPVEQLLASASAYACVDYWQVLLTSIAGLIALTGLFLNNVAIIIGAMLLSPILGPIHSFVIFAATGKTNDALQSLKLLSILLGSVFLVTVFATVILSGLALVTPCCGLTLELTEEILLRTGTGPIYILMAVLLGMAAMISLIKGYPEALAGVAVAAALLPPLVVAGVTLVLSRNLVPGAVLLTLDNIIGLIAGALIATLIIGVAPRRGEERRVARQFIKRTSMMIVLLLVILFVTSTLF